MSFLFRFFSSAPKITMADARTKVQQYIDSSPVGTWHTLTPRGTQR